MAKKGQSRLAKADKIIEDQVEALDEQLDVLEEMLKPYERIKERADRIRAARRALLGGTRTTGEGGTKLRMEDVTAFLRDNPGSTPGVIAEKFGVTQNTVSSHLYRGKGQRYLSKDGNWYLRDPKNGMNTEDDIDG
jgi:DNA-binding transcriptional ArsR family regulator